MSRFTRRRDRVVLGCRRRAFVDTICAVAFGASIASVMALTAVATASPMSGDDQPSVVSLDVSGTASCQPEMLLDTIQTIPSGSARDGTGGSSAELDAIGECGPTSVGFVWAADAGTTLAASLQFSGATESCPIEQASAINVELRFTVDTGQFVTVSSTLPNANTAFLVQGVSTTFWSNDGTTAPVSVFLPAGSYRILVQAGFGTLTSNLAESVTVTAAIPDTLAATSYYAWMTARRDESVAGEASYGPEVPDGEYFRIDCSCEFGQAFLDTSEGVTLSHIGSTQIFCGNVIITSDLVWRVPKPTRVRVQAFVSTVNISMVGVSSGFEVPVTFPPVELVLPPDDYLIQHFGAGDFQTGVMVDVLEVLSDEVRVPQDFPTITDAIAAVPDGGRVIVAAGTYNEQVDFAGKAITIESESGASSTTIDGTGIDGSVVVATSGEGPDSVLRGFEIRTVSPEPSSRPIRRTDWAVVSTSPIRRRRSRAARSSSVRRSSAAPHTSATPVRSCERLSSRGTRPRTTAGECRSSVAR